MPKPVVIPLAAGLQTELADQLVQPGATLVLENCYSPQTGKTKLRLGSDVLSPNDPTTLPSGGTVPTAWQLATLGGSLVRFNRAPVPIHVWASEPEAWVSPTIDASGLESSKRGPIKLDTSPVFSGTAQVSDVTVAVAGEVIVCVYHLNTGVAGTTGPTVVLMDRATRRPIFTRRTGGGARGARVVTVGTIAVVAYESGGFLQVDSYNLATYALAQQQTMSAVLSGTAIDMRVGSPVAGGSNVGILYRAVTSGELRLATLNATNLASNQTDTPRTTAGAVVVPNLGFGWMQDLATSAKFSVMIADTTDGLRTLWDLPAPVAGFTNATATHVLDATATGVPSGGTPGIRNIIGTTITNSATGVYRVLYEVTSPAFTTQATIKIAVWNGSASLGTQYRSVGIRSKFWQHSTNYYFLAAYDGTDQRSYFVLAMAGDTTVATTTFPAPLAVAFARDAAGFTENLNAASDVAIGSDGELYIGATEETHTESIASALVATGTTQRLFGVDIIRVRHPSTAETELGRPAEYLRSLFVPGGMLGRFDGAVYGSASFAYFPVINVTTKQVGGNLDADSTYRWRVVYSYMDRNGRKWRSAPSIPDIDTTSGTEFQFDVTIETLRIYDDYLVGGDYLIELYRTQANSDQAYFLVAAVTNDPTAHTLTIRDNVSDANLGEQLYTDGNGVENQLLPSIAWCVEHRGRLVVGEAGTGTIWYSVEPDFTNGLIFNEALTFDVADPSDPTTGAAVFNEQLFVFKAGKSYIVAGEYANALGQGQTLDERLLDGGIGCTNPQSIVVADDGVWFRSGSERAGMHRTAGAAPAYVGQGVHAYDALTITGAVVVRHLTQIRWYTQTGTTLIWDWITKIWSTNTGQQCLTATTGYVGTTGVVYARSDSDAIYSEATTASDQPYREGGTVYIGRIRSPWYQAAGISGWERVKRLQGVGSGGQAHRTQIALYKNLGASFQTASRVFPGSETRWNWQMRPAQQKLQSLLVEVSILPYQPADVAIAGDAADSYDGAGVWTFDNGAFSEADVGATLTIANGPAGKNGTYSITAVSAADEVTLSPLPANLTTGAFGVVATITLTPNTVSTAGPEIVGVALIAAAKEGMDKLPATQMAT